MNQTAIGSYIARKRREQNLTQEQLAQQLGVSNKTISKWENGKCMPDYSIIEPLCDALHVDVYKRQSQNRLFLIFEATTHWCEIFET